MHYDPFHENQVIEIDISWAFGIRVFHSEVMFIIESLRYANDNRADMHCTHPIQSDEPRLSSVLRRNALGNAKCKLEKFANSQTACYLSTISIYLRSFDINVNYCCTRRLFLRNISSQCVYDEYFCSGRILFQSSSS